MNEHLAEVSTWAAPEAHAAAFLDGAGWHTSGQLKLSANLILLPLPSHAPEFNPLENVREYLRGNRLSITVWNTYEQTVKTCCKAWNSLMQEPVRLAFNPIHLNSQSSIRSSPANARR
jgi:transposase